MCKQKIKRVDLIFFIVFLIIVIYLQYGRDMDAYNSYVFSVGSHNEQNLKIVATQTFLRSQWIVYILILLCCCVEDDCERSKLSGGQRKYRGRMTMERISCVETNQNCGAR